MRTPIIYVPTGNIGPHYTEAGYRPDCGGAGALTVIVQLKNGRRYCSSYEKEADRFSSLVERTITFRDVVCWHHLPGEEPELEREWFEAQFVKFRGIGPIGNRRGIYGKDVFGGYCIITPTPYGPDTEKIDDAYHHWVAAGRP